MSGVVPAFEVLVEELKLVVVLALASRLKPREDKYDQTGDAR